MKAIGVEVVFEKVIPSVFGYMHTSLITHSSCCKASIFAILWRDLEGDPLKQVVDRASRVIVTFDIEIRHALCRDLAFLKLIEYSAGSESLSNCPNP